MASLACYSYFRFRCWALKNRKATHYSIGVNISSETGCNNLANRLLIDGLYYYSRLLLLVDYCSNGLAIYLQGGRKQDQFETLTTRKIKWRDQRPYGWA